MHADGCNLVARAIDSTFADMLMWALLAFTSIKHTLAEPSLGGALPVTPSSLLINHRALGNSCDGSDICYPFPTTGNTCDGSDICDPFPSPPPPAAPHTVIVQLTASTGGSDYSPSVRTAIKNTLASFVGIGSDQVTVSVTATSVVIIAQVMSSSASNAEAVKRSLTTAISSPQAASAIFADIPGISIAIIGISITASPDVTTFPRDEPNDATGGGSTDYGLPLGLTAGLLAGLTFLAAYLFKEYKSISENSTKGTVARGVEITSATNSY